MLLKKDNYRRHRISSPPTKSNDTPPLLFTLGLFSQMLVATHRWLKLGVTRNASSALNKTSKVLLVV